jgi:hypothetical protein
MLDPRIPFKNRYFAGVLAFLLPGAGHVYQGRYFKGILCGVCVLVTFFYGMALGDWSVVYWKKDPTNFLNPYYAQVFVGLPALPSLVQARRYESRTNVGEMSISAPINARFHGFLRMHDRAAGLSDQPVTGQVELRPGTRPAEGRVVQGVFTGTVDKKETTLKLEGIPTLGKAVSADPDRAIEVEVVDNAEPPQTIGRLTGKIPRSFLDRFEAPPDEPYYLDLHGKLGKFHELAMTFTMIAGLLNILVILDAVEGPAYGYGDGGEQERKSDASGEKTDKTVPPAQPPPADARKKAQELAEKKAQEAAQKKAQELAAKKAQEAAENKAKEPAEK